MLITVGQQKGGSGKTTLLIMLANYLVQEHNYNIQILDWDMQESTYMFYQKDIDMGLKPLYNVELVKEGSKEEGFMRNEDFLIQQRENKEQLIIVDTAGHLKEEYVNLLNHSNFILIPFNYTEGVFHSTIRFAKFCVTINPDAQLIFIPNKIFKPKKEDEKAEKEEQKDFCSILEKFGLVIDNTIYYQKNMERVTTANLNWRQKKNTSKTFKKIVDLLQKQ